MRPVGKAARVSSVYRRAAVISGVYMLMALVWIAYSDVALESLVADTQQLTRLQTYKGWAFVVVTGVLLYLMTSLGYRAIAEREARYRALAEHLEVRVVERTHALEASNRDLKVALENLGRAQSEIIQAEKLAALGSLVAGIAHELSTPVGNGLMAASSLGDYASEFRQKIEGNSIRRSDMVDFSGRLRIGVDLLQRNLLKASELLASFKQVAVDRTSSQRRVFKLADVVSETLLTLSPMLRKTPFAVHVDIADDLVLDSYPGALGQVISNLIGNAVVHGFASRSVGHVAISACRATAAGDGVAEQLSISVSDDGAGIAPEHLARVFDPFFTTRLGQGGSGLGLHIAHNLVSGLLGGSVTVNSSPGAGATFTLHLPAQAPEA